MTDITAGTVETFDVVILGAGINGAGLFRDLCLQGLKCLIVDKADFGSGTSAAPSRLIHGGIKYLETGELGLVAQSTLERNLLLRNAPHCVEPLPTFIPSFSLTKGDGRGGRLVKFQRCGQEFAVNVVHTHRGHGRGSGCPSRPDAPDCDGDQTKDKSRHPKAYQRFSR
jgi:glycerol-3-phosphate dehydrogenase